MRWCRRSWSFLLLLGLPVGVLAADVLPEPIPPLRVQEIPIPEARIGPPAQSCDEALKNAAELAAGRGPGIPLPDEKEVDKEPPPSRTASGPVAAPPVPVPNPEITLAQLKTSDIPDPLLLPPQPLEGSPAAIRAAGEVLWRAEAGQPIRISFFGASHVGGEYFTGHLRRLLQARHGDRGHGFAWPASLYRNDRAQDLNLCRTEGWRSDWVGRSNGRDDGLHGFAGASLSSDDPYEFGWIETTHTNPQGRAMETLDIFTLGQPEGGTLLVTVDEAPPRAISTAAPAPVMQHFRLRMPDGPHRVSFAPLGDGEVRLFGVSAERDGPGVLVDAMGIRGRTARTWLSWDETMLVQGVRALDPDLIVLAYGTNEAADTGYSMERYRQDLVQVIQRARRAAPHAACVLVGPSDRAIETRRGQRWAIWGRTAPVAQVQREVASELGCASWDWQQAMGGPGSMIKWRLHDPPLAAYDLIHLSKEGYERSAERFLEALQLAAGLR